MATLQLPMTMEALVGGVDADAGHEPQFCPVRGLPIQRTHRVRALPGFHLLSLDAGKEAMARGRYEAFGKSFVCEGLEYLHPDDKVFICPQDNKAFQNQMSMRYHQYIRHELEERKAERKRLRERAEERKARADRHRQQPEAAAKSASSEPAPRTLPASAPAAATASAQRVSRPAPPVAEPQPPPQAVQEDPYLEVSRPPAEAAVPAVPAAGVVKQEVTETPRPQQEASPAVQPEQPEATTPAPAPSVSTAKPAAAAEEDDLYGDIGGGEAKRQKTGSSYASAMTAMLGGDFDDDE